MKYLKTYENNNKKYWLYDSYSREANDHDERY